MDVLPAPVPLISPGKYVDYPEPRWRLRPSVHLHGCCDSRPVLRPLDMPFPSASRLVFKAWMPDTLPALQEYAKFLLGQGSFQPQWLVGCYPQPSFLAHSLRPECILRFDSHFESGNLNRAYALSNQEYDLYVSPDTNTRGHTQWFYFSVSHAKPGATVTFNIVNLSKGNSLLAHGLRPVCKSGNGQWVKVSGEVSFYRNGYERTYWNKSVSVEEAGESEARKGWYYTLSFTHTFESDTEAFAFSPPYPLTRLVEFLDSLSSSWAVIHKETLCSSTLGLDFSLVTITAPKAQGRPLKLRPAIVFSARVHPGETPSSFLLEEIMRFLCSETEVSRQLLGLYVFHFIPMLNPDGVVLGNYRSCVEGVDLNRRWQSPHLEPLRSLRVHIQKVMSERKIALFCDLHAHAKKNNVFIYGCNTACDGGFTTWTKVRLFPRILARLSPYFNYEDCKFRVQKGKVGTGRVVIWKDFGVTNSFTLETSFHAYRKGADLCEFEERDFAVLAANVLESLAKYSELLEQFEQEVGLNGGWLKPGKLKELTGIPAQQLALMEQEEQLRKERFRQARLSVLPVVPQSSARSASARTKRPVRPAEDVVGVQLGKRGKQKVKQQGWRDYFTEEEVRTVLKRLKEGRDFEESESSGSESQPSEGNFSENEDTLQAETVEVEEEKVVLEEEGESAPPPRLSTPSPPLLILQSTPIVSQTLPTAIPDPPKPAKALHIPSPPVKLLSITQPLPDNVYIRPPVYPVSDISTILRSTHRGNASFDYSDFRRPRIHREARRAKRSSSPVFLIESYTVRKEPQVRTIKTLASTQRLGAESGWAAYASKQGLAATTRNAAVRVSRRQLERKWGRTNL